MHDLPSRRCYRTEKDSRVTVRMGKGIVVDFDWLEEGGCIDCEVDTDAMRVNNFYDLIWRCGLCGGGSAPLEPFTP